MSIEFETDSINRSYTSRKILGEPVVPGMTKVVVHLGLASDEEGAHKILLAVVTISLIAACFIYYLFVAHGGHASIPESAIYT